MAKITFLGAGSMIFTRRLARDILTFPLMRDSTICLMDIDKQRLEYSRKCVEHIVRIGKYKARIETTMDRKKALSGADAVLCTILSGGVEVWRHDIEIPKKYGVDINIGDTRGPSGIFRALRTVPVMLDICRDMEKICPDAILLNYTNPMSMLCRAMQKKSEIRVTGLCHSVQATAMMLAGLIGVGMDRVTFLCAGINHQSWYIEFRKDGKDAYPEIKREIKKKENYWKSPVRNEMCLALGYYVTESGGHNSEYNWWFRKRPDLLKIYFADKNGVPNSGRYGRILELYLDRKTSWKKLMEEWIEKTGKNEILQPGHEYASRIINAYIGGDPFLFNGNVPNTGIITNLPDNVCVEVPVLADRRGFSSIHVGNLPAQCAALNNISIAVEEMAVEGILEGNAEKIYQAICYDPLTAAVLSLGEIRSMVNEMFEKNRDYMPGFKKKKA